MCQPLLARLPGPIEKALAEAKLTPADLASVEIVGGSTRIGSVKETLIQALGGKQLSTTMNADEAVGRGAALQSAILSPRFKVLPYEIQEYQPFPVKVAWDEVTEGTGMEIEGETDGDDLPANSVTMFDRGLNFPVVRRVTLRRSGDFGVNATYDEEAQKFGYPANVSTDIATFAIKAPAGDVKKVRVNVKEDIHGIISLSSAQMVEEIEEEAPPKEEGDKKEGEEAEAKAEEEKKKKKIKRTNLEFSTSRPLDWTKAEIDSAYEIEVSMSNVDRVFRETSDKRNELESYIYDMRDKINSESGLSLFATDEEKSAFSDALEKSENWLYEDGFDATKSVYAEKLDQLKKLGDPIESRHNEAAQRPGAFSALQKYVEQCRNWLNNIQTDEKYKHITDEEREDCHLKCDEISSWVYDQLDKQGSLPQNVDPVVTVQNINDRSKELQKVMDPIIKKPAPKKEEKKPEPKVEEPDDTKKEEAKKDEAEPMETDKPADEAEPMDGVDVAPLD
jgi:heat shock protein 4